MYNPAGSHVRDGLITDYADAVALLEDSPLRKEIKGGQNVHYVGGQCPIKTQAYDVSYGQQLVVDLPTPEGVWPRDLVPIPTELLSLIQTAIESPSSVTKLLASKKLGAKYGLTYPPKLEARTEYLTSLLKHLSNR